MKCRETPPHAEEMEERIGEVTHLAPGSYDCVGTYVWDYIIVDVYYGPSGVLGYMGTHCLGKEDSRVYCKKIPPSRRHICESTPSRGTYEEVHQAGGTFVEVHLAGGTSVEAHQAGGTYVEAHQAGGTCVAHVCAGGTCTYVEVHLAGCIGGSTPSRKHTCLRRGE